MKKSQILLLSLVFVSTGCASSGPLIGKKFGEPFSGSPHILHKAVDYYDRYGAPVIAVDDGVVSIVDLDGTVVRHGRENGVTVVIEHSGHRYSSYGHLSKVVVKAGQQVRRGEKIGENGNTGTRGPSSNLPPAEPHVHLEITHGGSYVDPGKYMVGCFESGKTYKPGELTYPVNCENSKK